MVLIIPEFAWALYTPWNIDFHAGYETYTKKTPCQKTLIDENSTYVYFTEYKNVFKTSTKIEKFLNEPLSSRLIIVKSFKMITPLDPNIYVKILVFPRES